MDILFCEAPIEEDINSILSLLTLNEEHMRVKKYICEYFHIPTELALQNNAALETTVRTIVQNEQNNNAAAIAGKIEKMNCLWQENRDGIDRTLRSIFECTLESQQLRALMSVNCVCPYDFENNQIYINYRKSSEEMLETCVHELIHYYWFHKWNALFKDQYSSSLVWIFSEIAIDALFFETPLKNFFIIRNYNSRNNLNNSGRFDPNFPFLESSVSSVPINFSTSVEKNFLTCEIA